jgi:alpha-acetolactate decarboxylase
MADVPAKKVAEPAKKAEAKPVEPDEVVPDVSVVEYGAESEPKTGKSAEQAVKEAAASQVAATEAQDEAFADDPPRHVAATKVTNIQTPTGMVQRVDELAEEQPTESGYETRPVGSGG